MTGNHNRRTFLKTLGVGTAALATHGLHRADANGSPARVYRVHHVPVPDYAHSNRHPGVESLIFSMAMDGCPFYQTSNPHPLGGTNGLIGVNDTVLFKVNAQWKYRGGTNTDVTRGVIQRILDHPDGFAGEVVIIENGQGRGSLNCDTTAGCDGGTREVHANAENESHSFSWMVDELFQDTRVGERLLDGVRQAFIDENDHDTEGYRRDENAVSYPCFFTPQGRRIELKHGIWDGASFDKSKLKWISIPTMKDHKDLNVTGCSKMMYGMMSLWGMPFDFHVPQEGGRLIGNFYSSVGEPVLHILDNIWVPHASLCGYPPDTTTRRNMICAGFDPLAVDSWAARHILYPISGDPAHDPDSPGLFRSYLLEAVDVLNANGGVDGGREATIDPAKIDVEHQDQREVQLGTYKSGADIRLTWGGGQPPYRVEKDVNPAFTGPSVLVQSLWGNELTDFGAASDGQTWFYRVIGS